MLLKAGVVMMTLALAFAAVAALIAFYDEPMERAVAEKKPVAEATVKPLVRSYPPPKPRADRVERPQPQPEPEPKPEPNPPPAPGGGGGWGAGGGGGSPNPQRGEERAPPPPPPLRSSPRSN